MSRPASALLRVVTPAIGSFHPHPTQTKLRETHLVCVILELTRMRHVDNNIKTVMFLCAFCSCPPPVFSGSDGCPTHLQLARIHSWFLPSNGKIFPCNRHLVEFDLHLLHMLSALRCHCYDMALEVCDMDKK